jgi:hypothetical protein
VEYFTRIRQISLRVGLTSIVLALFAAFSGRWPEALGVLIGSLAALLNFRFLSRSLLKHLDLPPGAAQKGAAVQCVFRYILIVSVVLLANTAAEISVWAVFVGLFLIKAVILGEALFTFSRQSFQGFLRIAGWERGDK